MIKYGDKNSEREFDNETSSRRYTFATIAIVLLFLVIFAYLPTVDKDLFAKVLEWLALLCGGFGAGYGFKELKSKREN